MKRILYLILVFSLLFSNGLVYAQSGYGGSGGGGGGGGSVLVQLLSGNNNGNNNPVTNNNVVPQGQVLGAEKYVFTLYLRVGSHRDASKVSEIRELQMFLNTSGYGPLVVDGKFGQKTKAAVVKLQLANGLRGDGVVGPLTRAVLNQ